MTPERERVIALTLAQIIVEILSPGEHETARSGAADATCSHPEEYVIDASSFAEPHKRFCKFCLSYFSVQLA